VCTQLLACEGTTSESQADCVESCEEQQSSCAARGAGSQFDALLSCLSSVSCSSPTQFEEQEQTSCGSQIDAIEMDCPSQITLEASVFDGPSIDVEGPESGVEDAPFFDVPPIDVAPPPPKDAGVSPKDGSPPPKEGAAG
jgi:hypothetical protein